jgi:hypothetical protein
LTGRKPASEKGLERESRLAPGHFVSDELRTDCERFLDDVKRLVERRHAAEERRVGLPPK